MFSWNNASHFAVLLEKATSTRLLEPDWLVIIEMCDSIRSGESDPKGALNAVKKKLLSKNPNVTMLALHCLESMVKNCGHSIHKEVATVAFMDDFKGLLRLHDSDVVREKVLELIQTWAHAFRKEPAYRAVQDAMTFMRAVEGVKFPQFKESDAMFAAQVPPEWEDSDCCHLCRQAFSTFNRKHHCRKCGQVFCGKCSSQTAALPKLGIEKKVRVCETCFLEVTPENGAHSSPLVRMITAAPSAAGQSSPTKTQEQAAKEAKLKEAQLREEEELQLAIALSESEAEFKSQRTRGGSLQEDTKKTDERRRSVSGPTQQWTSPGYPDVVEANAPTRSECGSTTGSTESELTHYLDRKYWDERSNRVGETDTPKYTAKPLEGMPSPINEADAQFEQVLEKSLDTFVNRLRSNEMRGRPIANDTYVQSLFMQISSLHARLLQCVQDTEDQRAYYETLQDKLQQIRDARAALDALRDEHKEEERKKQEEAERARQLQMAHKLEIMRQRKHEYLQYQHHLAMMKMQEQEMQYRAVGIPPPGMPPMGAMPPNPQISGAPVYTPQPQYPTGMLPPGAIPSGSVPQPPYSHPQQPQQAQMSPPHTVPLGVVQQQQPQPPYYAPMPYAQAPQNAAAMGHLPQPQGGAEHMQAPPIGQTPQQQPPQHTQMPTAAHSHVPQPGSGQTAFEPYGMEQMIAAMPSVPQTPLPQPCAPPQTPTPSQQELNLPSVPTHEPGIAAMQQQQQQHIPVQQHEAQLISFD